jgi:hypothetical protein
LPAHEHNSDSMRTHLRFLSIVLSSLAVLSCVDATGGTGPGARRAVLSIAPRFEAGASRTAASLAQSGLSFDHVRVFVVRPASDIPLADTTFAYSASDTATTLVLSVLAVPNDSLIVTMQYRAGITVVFEGSASTRATALNTPVSASNTVEILVTYTGPGATAKTITVAPSASSITSAVPTLFSATAFDAANVVLTNGPLPFVWSVSDTTIATIGAVSGLLTPKVSRGTVVVSADLPSAHASLTVQLAPLATGLHVIQGAAQSGAPGTQLPVPVIIELIAADGQPGLASGLTATFTPNTGGSASPASVALDASGRAQTLLTLGPTAGNVYLYTVTAGSFSILVPEIATVGIPTQVIASGGTSFTVAAGAVPSPLPTFRLADALGNSVPLFPLKAVISAVTANGTKSDSVTFAADTIGLGDLSRFALTVAGTYTVTISSANPTIATFPPLVYSLTVNPGPAAKLGFGVPPSDVPANTTMSPPVTVLVQDTYGNTVTTSSASITLALDATSIGAGVTGSGFGPATAVNGIATFTGLKFAPTGKTGVKLVATSGALTSALSTGFAIK